MISVGLKKTATVVRKYKKVDVVLAFEVIVLFSLFGKRGGTKWTFFVVHFCRRHRSPKSLDLVLLLSRGQQTQLHIIACFASFESSRHFSFFYYSVHFLDFGKEVTGFP